MFQNHKQNTIRQNNPEQNNTHPNNRQSSHHKTHPHPPHCSHHNNACPTRLIFSTQRNTTPYSRPPATHSSTNTPCPTVLAQGLHFPHKQTNSCVAVLEGLSESQAHWQSKRFGNDEPTKTRKKPTK